jgi:uncharacterized protein (TIGR03000 family)
MPGWDWWRTYPWSPYNIYNPNNPYSPYYHWNYPQPYPYPYPYPYPVPYVNPYLNPANYPTPTTVPTATLPTPIAAPIQTGQLSLAPLSAAGIKLRLPDPNAVVAFNGQVVPGVGSTRWYLSPTLPDGSEYLYTVTVQVYQNGRTAQVQRQIMVGPGRITEADFTHPDPADVGTLPR